ncbi:myotubularin-related protein 2-like [Planoprotostelium fungivorum]|uniref:Myotubularin-related protein 2-like n=1 Tax=Planoprotostelium fungivorum TaxID=1890364 RepID=A0A2P6NQP4_9EUKA|nr:myotubularin-related protein 2-like [Planoprotostelium fungivorum]
MTNAGIKLSALRPDSALLDKEVVYLSCVEKASEAASGVPRPRCYTDTWRLVRESVDLFVEQSFSEISIMPSGQIYVEVVKDIIQSLKSIMMKAKSAEPLDATLSEGFSNLNKLLALIKPKVEAEEKTARDLWSMNSVAAIKVHGTTLEIFKHQSALDLLRSNYISLKASEENEAFGSQDTTYLTDQKRLVDRFDQLRVQCANEITAMEAASNKLASFIKRHILRVTTEERKDSSPSSPVIEVRSPASPPLEPRSPPSSNPSARPVSRPLPTLDNQTSPPSLQRTSSSSNAGHKREDVPSSSTSLLNLRSKFETAKSSSTTPKKDAISLGANRQVRPVLRDAKLGEAVSPPMSPTASPKTFLSTSRDAPQPEIKLVTSVDKLNSIENRKIIMRSSNDGPEAREAATQRLSLFMLVRPTRKELEDLKILLKEDNSLSLASSQEKPTITPVASSPIPASREDFKLANDMKNADYQLLQTGFVKNLMVGEKSYLMAQDVYYRDAKHSWTKGLLVLTSYRVAFIGPQTIVLPLGYVNAIDPVKKSGTKPTGKGDNQKKLEIETKDHRKLYFTFPRTGQCSRSHFVSTTRSKLNQAPERLFAFEWKDTFPINGWKIYDPVKEFERMGVVNETGWKVSHLNTKYELCPTYPAYLALPIRMAHQEIQQVANYRSKGRIPALSWIHRGNSATITRCSQPRVGVTRRRSVEDEKMIAEILGANKHNSVLNIFDARPSANARANQMMGAGTENMNNYPNCVLTFHNIDNIHVMRESLKCLNDAVTMEDDSKYLGALSESGWFGHICKILTAVSKIVDVIENKKGSVLVHCSDGWDRTPQMTSLSMMMLDPYYRTLLGFQVLLEKEFIGFGHQFALRTGHDGQGKLSERSPVFLQFVDCVYQLSLQFPREFEFNEHFMTTLVEESFFCRFGTFLYDCELHRMKARVRDTTNSLWSMINSNPKKYTNPLYRPSQAVLFPSANMKKFKMWDSYYFRYTPEMMGPTLQEKLEELTSNLQIK